MGIISQWISLKHQQSETGKHILGLAFESAFKSMVALYESTFDRAHWAVSASDQFYEGHDHSDINGGAFPRGLCYSEDTGSSMILDASFSANLDPVPLVKFDVWPYRIAGFAQCFPSPNLNGMALGGKILYEAIDGDFEIMAVSDRVIGNSSQYNTSAKHWKGRGTVFNGTLKQTSDTGKEQSVKAWADFEISFYPGEWNWDFIRVAPTKEDSALKVYSVIFAEVLGESKIYTLGTLDGSRGGDQ